MRGGNTMLGSTPSIETWEDRGLAGIVDDESTGMPLAWETVGPTGFGDAIDDMGWIDGSALAGIGVEVEEQNWGGLIGARTPMLEVSPEDFTYVSFCGEPYDGMMAFGDDGEIYEYDGTLGRGFFKRLFKKIGSGIRKVGQRIKKGITKVLKKSRFGRFLLKIGRGIKKIAMKIVGPLMKFVGKWASKLAPIAALIPGYGTAISAGLAAAGKIANYMNKFGVTTKGKKGKVRGLKLKNPKMLKPFQAALKKEAKAMKGFAKKNPKKFKALLAKQKQRLRA